MRGGEEREREGVALLIALQSVLWLCGHTPENCSRAAGQSRETKDRAEEGDR